MKPIKRKFTVKNIVPFDLMRWGKDGFYNFIDAEYQKLFGRTIEILEADLKFISGGVSIDIVTYRAGATA